MSQRRAGSGYIRKIDFMFCKADAIRYAVACARQDPGNIPMGKNASNISDPTASKAIRAVTLINRVTITDRHGRTYTVDYPERWLYVINKTYSWCKLYADPRYDVAKRRYSGESYHKTCREINISHTTYVRLLEKVRVYAALQAAQMGLIYVE